MDSSARAWVSSARASDAQRATLTETIGAAILPSERIERLQPHGANDLVAQLGHDDDPYARQDLPRQAGKQERDLAQRARRPLRVDDHERLGLGAEGRIHRDVETHVIVGIEPLADGDVASRGEGAFAPTGARLLPEQLDRLEERTSANAASEVAEDRV